MPPRSRSLVLIALSSFLILLPFTSVLGDSVFVEEGRNLYQKLCSGCHGDIRDSAKTGRSMTRIRSALRSFDQHRSVSALPDEQILLIAMALREGEN